MTFSLKINGLRKQKNKLAERANQRQAELKTMQQKLQKFHDALQQVNDSIAEATEELDQQSTAAGDVDAIKQQIRELKVSAWREKCFLTE